MNMEILCKIRDVYRSIAEYEAQFTKLHSLSLNEGMVLCSLSKTEHLASGEIAELLGLTASNASKVIKSVEAKKLIKRVMGSDDRRHMYFSLTMEGLTRLNAMKSSNQSIPEHLLRLVDNND